MARGVPRRRKRTPVGASPGTLVADPSSAPTSLTCFRYGPDFFEEHRDAEAGDLKAWADGDGLTWINVDGLADIELIRRIGESFGIHRLALEDVVNLHQRPKLEEYDGQIFIVTQMLADPADTAAEQLSLFLGPDYVITFQERSGDCLENVRERLRSENGRIRLFGPDYLTYAILDAVIDGYFPALEQHGELIEALENDVIDKPRNAQMRKIHQVKRDLFELRRALWPQREMINALMRHEGELVAQPTVVYLRDCYDHTVQLIDILETYREISSGLVDIYLTSLSNRMNEIMKVLTIMATIFIPLSFIASLYGMNFDRNASAFNMPELGWRYGYVFALALMSAVAGGLLFYFVRRGWIGRDD